MALPSPIAGGQKYTGAEFGAFTIAQPRIPLGSQMHRRRPQRHQSRGQPLPPA